MTDSFLLSRTDIPILSQKHETFHVYGQSHVGSVRKENQDFYGFEQKSDFSFLIVLDGMGGHSGGFEASRIACTHMLKYFRSHCSPEVSAKDFLRAAITKGHEAILQFASKNTQMEGMGTTVVCALIHNNTCWIAHVGDSRAHILRNETLFQLTIDHTCVHQLALTGDLSLEDMNNHPMSHILDRSMGSEETLDIEVYPKPILLQQGDRILLSSDGFLQYVEDHDIEELMNISDLKTSAQKCIDISLMRGGSDNITVGIFAYTAASTNAENFVEDARTAFHAKVKDAQQKNSFSAPASSPPAGSLRVEYAHEGEFVLPPPPEPSSATFYLIFAVSMMSLGIFLGSFL